MAEHDLRQDPLYRVFRALRAQVVVLTDGFTHELRDRLDQVALDHERRPPTLFGVLMSVALDTTNLLAGLGESVRENNQDSSDD